MRAGWSGGDNYEVLDENHNAISLCMRKCSCRRWEVYGLPCKHASATIIQTDANVHRYIDQHFTVNSYQYVYIELIYPIPSTTSQPTTNAISAFDRQSQGQDPGVKEERGSNRRRSMFGSCTAVDVVK